MDAGSGDAVRSYEGRIDTRGRMEKEKKGVSTLFHYEIDFRTSLF